MYIQFFSDLGLEDYDTVTYFDQNKPVKTQSKYSFKYKDAVWQFHTQENLDKIISMPRKYAPQYGGYHTWLLDKPTFIKKGGAMWPGVLS